MAANKKIRGIIIAVVVIGLIVFISYNEQPFSMMGANLGDKANVEDDQEIADASYIVTPDDTFPEGSFESLGETVGKTVIQSQFSNSGVVEQLSQNIRVDIAVYRNDFAHRVFSRGLIQRLDLTQIENLDEQYLELPFVRWVGYKTGGGPAYAVPYIVERNAILIENGLLSSDLSWDLFWDTKHKGKIGTTSLETMVYLAAVLEGVSSEQLAEDTETSLSLIEGKCQRLLENEIRIYDTDRAMLDDLINGTISIVLISEEKTNEFLIDNPGYIYVSPKEGAIGWVYSLAIPVRVQDKEVSYRLLQEMFQPPFAARLFKFSGKQVLVPKIEDQLSGESREDFLRKKSDFDKLIIFGNLAGEPQKLFDSFVEALQ